MFEEWRTVKGGREGGIKRERKERRRKDRESDDYLRGEREETESLLTWLSGPQY